MAPPINVQDWYGDRHTCQIASGALGRSSPYRLQGFQLSRSQLVWHIRTPRDLAVSLTLIPSEVDRSLNWDVTVI